MILKIHQQTLEQLYNAVQEIKQPQFGFSKTESIKIFQNKKGCDKVSFKISCDSEEIIVEKYNDK